MFIGSVLALLFDVVWVFFVAFAATPCGFSGRGILTPTLECPVQATHVVSVAFGGASALSLLVGGVAGLSYSRGGEPRKGRIFRIGLLVSLVLIVTLLVLIGILPRHAASD